MTTDKRKTSERVIRMKQGFMELHNSGKTIPEIATIYGLSFHTVYMYLQEIADENNVSRESLLVHPKSKHVFKAAQTRNRNVKKQPVNFDEVSTSLDSVLSGLENLISKIDDISEEISKEDIDNEEEK